jgi:hypothetical protein
MRSSLGNETPGDRRGGPGVGSGAGPGPGRPRTPRPGQIGEISAILAVVKISHPRRVTLNGRATPAYNFTGDPAAHARGMEQSAAKMLSGALWFDARLVLKTFRQDVHVRNFDFRKFSTETVERTGTSSK